MNLHANDDDSEDPFGLDEDNDDHGGYQGRFGKNVIGDSVDDAKSKAPSSFVSNNNNNGGSSMEDESTLALQDLIDLEKGHISVNGAMIPVHANFNQQWIEECLKPLSLQLTQALSVKS
jgi:hypothetical protein